MDRNRTVLWGLLLVGIGVFLLLRNADVIPQDVGPWPPILIAIGVWLVLERALFGGGGGFVWPILFVAVGVVLLLDDLDVPADEDIVVPVIVIAVGVGLALSAFSRSRSSGAEDVTVLLEGATEANVRIDHGAGRLRVGSMLGGAELVRGRCVGGARTEVRRSGSRLDLSMRSTPGGWRAAAREGGLTWDLTINRQVPVALDLNTGAGEAELDLTDLHVTELAVSTGASKVALNLPSTGRYEVRLKAGAASVRVRVPVNVAARIGSRSGLADVKVDERRFPRTEGEWRSRDLETAEHRADIRIEVGAAAVEIG